MQTDFREFIRELPLDLMTLGMQIVCVLTGISATLLIGTAHFTSPVKSNDKVISILRLVDFIMQVCLIILAGYGAGTVFCAGCLYLMD